MTTQIIDFGLMTIKDFARSIHKPESTVRTWKRRGDLPNDFFITIGAAVFVKADTFKDWINQQT